MAIVLGSKVVAGALLDQRRLLLQVTLGCHVNLLRLIVQQLLGHKWGARLRAHHCYWLAKIVLLQVLIVVGLLDLSRLVLLASCRGSAAGCDVSELERHG